MVVPTEIYENGRDGFTSINRGFAMTLNYLSFWKSQGVTEESGGGENHNKGIYGIRRNIIIATLPQILRSFHSLQDDIYVLAILEKRE
jgi:hypothetical protein